MDVLTASLRSACSLRSRHFVNGLNRSFLGGFFAYFSERKYEVYWDMRPK
ncbi:gluconate 5-dehydrogenase [Yersinia enterocolitica subsp. palearctica]|nr:gluconate 5-dehydrogenase [Yersinia enterocolitica subsp. palearctica]